MTTTKAHQIGTLGTFVSAAIVTGLIVYAIAVNNFTLLDFIEIGEQMTLFFLDLYIPLLIVFSIKFGRKLGEHFFIKREEEVIYYSLSIILHTAGLSVISTLVLMHPYFLFMEWVEEEKMLSIYSFIIYLFYLLWDLIIIAFCGIFIYAILLIPCAIVGLFCSLIFKWIRK